MSTFLRAPRARAYPRAPRARAYPRAPRARPWAARVAVAGVLAALAAACSPAVPIVAAGAVTTAAVAEERTTRDALTDIEIETTINNNLLNASPELFRRVGVDVVEGRVLLSGAVSRQDQRIEAVKQAWAAPGVREVINELSLAGDPGIQRYSQDLWITTQLRSRMVADAGIRSINYNIETHRGVVNLIGLARSPQELQRVTRIAAAIPGVTSVVSHVLSIDDPRRLAQTPRPDGNSDGFGPAPAPAAG
ncbi:BON domain-containing protein [Rubrimonas cliftonensis]|nr:BON domain-containing protein [Rubrimonas cliftonensis]